VNCDLEIEKMLQQFEPRTDAANDRYHPTENEIEPGANGEGKTAIPIQSSICVLKPINSSE